MSDNSPNLAMPFILPSQAQKHVTHNEALLLLDALVHLTIREERQGPPDTTDETVTDGACYLIATEPTGSWAGRADKIAAWQDGAWNYLSPRLGWRAWFASETQLKVFDGSLWRQIPLPDEATVTMLGIGTDPDATNRFALSSAASLFNHEGNGHQIKVNKAATTDTASLLFQTAWSGRAEMGLAGDDLFSIKVSDGTTWRTGIRIDADGSVHQPGQPTACAYRSGTSFSPVAGQESGFTDFAVANGGVALGTALAGGGNTLIVPVSGIYLLTLTLGLISSAGHGVDLLVDGTEIRLSLRGSASGQASQSATALVALEAGAGLSLGHLGSAEIACGQARTCLSLALL